MDLIKIGKTIMILNKVICMLHTNVEISHHTAPGLSTNIMSKRSTNPQSIKNKNKMCKIMIDTGSSVNTLNEKTFRHVRCPKLKNLILNGGKHYY